MALTHQLEQEHSRPRRSGICPGCGRTYPPSDSFQSLLTWAMAKYKTNPHDVEAITGLDHAYVSRLARGLKLNPSADAVTQIVFALAHRGLKFDEANELVEAAGYRSPFFRRYRDDPVDEPDPGASSGGGATPRG